MQTSIGRRALLGAGVAAAALPRRTHAADKPIRIGVLTDMTGVYAANTGPGSVLGAQMAVEDFMRAHPDDQGRGGAGRPAAQARCRAGDRRRLVRQPGRRCGHRRAAVLGGVRDRRSGEAEGQGRDLHRRRVGRHHRRALRSQPSALGLRHLVDAARRGGRGGEGRRATPGSSSPPTMRSAIRCRRTPRASSPAPAARCSGQALAPFPGTTDFSSFLVQAKASGAKAIGLANGGSDTVNCIKQAAEFGIMKGGQKVAGLIFLIHDVHGVGLDGGAGRAADRAVLLEPERRHARVRKRFAAAFNGVVPGSVHAGQYSAVTHYLKAVDCDGRRQGARPADARRSSR